MATKNLFLESFTHLGVKQPEYVPPVEKVEKNVVKPVEKPENIHLGAGKVYTDPEEAYKYLLSLPKEDLPSGYRNTLSKSFLKSSGEGQVSVLFKDWKRYKEGILGKMDMFFQSVKSNNIPILRKYVSFLFGNKTPKDIDTYLENKVDLTYFKFWVLFKFFTSNRSK
jgi:hypothetical protein